MYVMKTPNNTEMHKRMWPLLIQGKQQNTKTASQHDRDQYSIKLRPERVDILLKGRWQGLFEVI